MLKTRIDRYLVKKAMRGRYSTFGGLAKAASISTTTMTKATDSNEWRSSTLDAIADALGVSPLALLVVEEVVTESESSTKATASPTDAPPAPAPSAAPVRTKYAMPAALGQIPEAEAERRRALLAQAQGLGQRGLATP